MAKPRSGDQVELRIQVPVELYEEMKRLKEFYSHIEPDADWVAVLRLLTRDALKRRDPLARKPGQPSGPRKPQELELERTSGDPSNVRAATVVRRQQLSGS